MSEMHLTSKPRYLGDTILWIVGPSSRMHEIHNFVKLEEQACDPGGGVGLEHELFGQSGRIGLVFFAWDTLHYMGHHTRCLSLQVFGEVVEGFKTLTRTNEAYIDDKGRPYKNIRIKHTYVLDDPLDDPPQLSNLIPNASPEGKPKDEVDNEVWLEDDWVPIDEQLGPAELEEVIRAKDAHSSAVVLESIGDIPDTDIKPPDNVLFVCKLNSVTEDEDLHTIFSRFGTVLSAEVIRDYKTGDSLCYAFIEFETNKACEQAFHYWKILILSGVVLFLVWSTYLQIGSSSFCQKNFTLFVFFFLLLHLFISSRFIAAASIG
ncbi:hypothetical protein UlMin_011661 [Ulmus minor]